MPRSHCPVPIHPVSPPPPAGWVPARPRRRGGLPPGAASARVGLALARGRRRVATGPVRRSPRRRAGLSGVPSLRPGSPPSSDVRRPAATAEDATSRMTAELSSGSLWEPSEPHHPALFGCSAKASPRLGADTRTSPPVRHALVKPKSRRASGSGMSESEAIPAGGAAGEAGAPRDAEPPRLGPRPLDRPIVDPAVAAVFGGARSGVGRSSPCAGPPRPRPSRRRPAPRWPTHSAARPARTGSLQRPPRRRPGAPPVDPAPLGDAAEDDPWRDPGSTVGLGPPPAAARSRNDGPPRAEGARLSLREVLFGRRAPAGAGAPRAGRAPHRRGRWTRRAGHGGRRLRAHRTPARRRPSVDRGKERPPVGGRHRRAHRARGRPWRSGSATRQARAPGSSSTATATS